MLRASPSMEIFMISLQVGWTWWFLKDPFQLKALWADTIAFAGFVTLLGLQFLFFMEQLPLAPSWRSRTREHHSTSRYDAMMTALCPNLREGGWQIPQFASSEGSSLITLFSSLKSRGRKPETLSVEKLFKDQRKNYLCLAQAFPDFCLMASISGWSVSAFSKLNLEVCVRMFCKPKI